jgi:small multidrug resistance pump
LLVIIGYAISFYCLSLVLRTIPVGITYAIWTGIGIVLVTLAGIFLYEEIPDLPALLGMVFIIAGVVIITAFSKTIHH